MEDVYTIKVKTKPDTRNLYPSERRYSASTVSGLAWVHITLAAVSFLLACMALISPIGGGIIKHVDLADGEHLVVDKDEYLYNITHESTESTTKQNRSDTENQVQAKAMEYGWILVIAPSLLTLAALAAGFASIMASTRWYIDRNITWLFLMSILSTILSFISFTLIATWIISTAEGTDNLSEFYKDKVPFTDFIVVKQSDIVERNSSHLVVSHNGTLYTDKGVTEHSLTKRVLSINIMIASFLEFLWSLLSLKISWKGMRNQYKDDDELGRRGNCIAVVTTVKGNKAKKLPRNTKFIPPKPDLVSHYPTNNKIRQFFLAQGTNGFYLKNQNEKINTKPGTESSSQYRERMLNFLNKCASMDNISDPEAATPSIYSEATLNTIPEITFVEVNLQENANPSETHSQNAAQEGRISSLSWGDAQDHTIYNQNTLDLDNILRLNHRPADEPVTNELKTESVDVENKTEDKVVTTEIVEES